MPKVPASESQTHGRTIQARPRARQNYCVRFATDRTGAIPGRYRVSPEVAAFGSLLESVMVVVPLVVLMLVIVVCGTPESFTGQSVAYTDCPSLMFAGTGCVV